MIDDHSVQHEDYGGVIFMSNTVDFTMTTEAYDQLEKLLAEHDEYDCVLFTLTKGCRAPRVELTLDELNSRYLLHKYNDVVLAYTKELADFIKSIEMKLEKGQMFMKANPREKIEASSCGSCGGGCGGCSASSDGCGGCNSSCKEDK